MGMHGSSIRRTETLIPSAGGGSLFRREWLPRDPERVLLLVHGLAEHSGRYAHVGAWFAARGCAVHAYDQRGHGKSVGIRGHLRRFSDFLDDVDVMLGHVRQVHADLPAFLVGHSLGGLVAATFVRERQPEIAGVVTSGAALRLGNNVSRSSIVMARAVAAVLPRVRFSTEIDPMGLSSDPQVVRDYLDDPLVFSKITVAFAREIFGAIERTAAGAADVSLPMLLLHGEADPICPVEASRGFFEKIGSAEKQITTYPGLLHEIFNEPSREQVFDDLLAWVREREG
jgi:alpha-beta hydrolase superfamily lysophospholipase